MMQNFEVSKPPKLKINRIPPVVEISWASSVVGWTLEFSTSLNKDSSWQQVGKQPENVDGKWRVTLSETDGPQFYRLRIK